MSAPIALPPDGVAALAALIAIHGQPAPLGPALAAAVVAAPTDGPQARLAELCARRRHLGPASSAAGPAPAARFCRRLHRRWRVPQGPPIDAARLARAGRRAARRGLGWADATPTELGVWLAFWAQTEPGRRHDLLATVDLAAARRVIATPLATDAARRLWR